MKFLKCILWTLVLSCWSSGMALCQESKKGLVDLMNSYFLGVPIQQNMFEIRKSMDLKFSYLMDVESGNNQNPIHSDQKYWVEAKIKSHPLISNLGWTTDFAVFFDESNAISHKRWIEIKYDARDLSYCYELFERIHKSLEGHYQFYYPIEMKDGEKVVGEGFQYFTDKAHADQDLYFAQLRLQLRDFPASSSLEDSYEIQLIFFENRL